MHEAVCIPTHVLKAPKPLLQHLALQGVAVKWEVIGDEALEIGQLLSLQLVQVVPPPPKRLPTAALVLVLCYLSVLTAMELRIALPHYFDPVKDSFWLGFLRRHTKIVDFSFTSKEKSINIMDILHPAPSEDRNQDQDQDQNQDQD
ncbi:hypothetical protein BDV98DRAFT_592544 [Pterulicium gracile]|uniref:Uncharacterized protein n=1 Tax=Pterulicium gracile TaxID=1884261 RepID=A0A5C3QKK6_9AGAR|nr:hypothetical protein BDV98DRAFT_592544 [Pterula gracilis]